MIINNTRTKSKFFIGIVLSLTINSVKADEGVTRDSLVEWVTTHSGYNVSKIIAIKIINNVINQANKQNIDPFLLLSLIKNESSFNTNATSVYGAKGLMQVVPRWHQDKIAGRTITNISTNIEVGANVLNDCINKHNEIINKALSCYSGNAGNYVNKLNDTYLRIKNHDVAYRFTNELPITNSGSFIKPRDFEIILMDNENNTND